MELDISTKLLPLLPPYYREIEEFQAICGAEKAKLDEIKKDIDRILSNEFLQTMDVQSCALWESLLKIAADPTTETLEFRRERIILRLQTRPPYTLTWLYNLLNSYLGEGNWSLPIDYDKYHIHLDTDFDGHSTYDEICNIINAFDEVLHMIYTVKPAHMEFDGNMAINTAMDTTHIGIRSDTSYGVMTTFFDSIHYNVDDWYLDDYLIGGTA